MKIQDGEEILHELMPEKNILWIWFFTKALSVGIAGGAVSFGLVGFSGIIFRIANIIPPPPRTIAMFAKVSMVLIIPTSSGSIIFATNKWEAKTMNCTE